MAFQSVLGYFMPRGQEMKYNDSGNGWTFIAVSSWKAVNPVIGGVGMLLSPCVLKSLNSIEKI